MKYQKTFSNFCSHMLSTTTTPCDGFVRNKPLTTLTILKRLEHHNLLKTMKSKETYYSENELNPILVELNAYFIAWNLSRLGSYALSSRINQILHDFTNLKTALAKNDSWDKITFIEARSSFDRKVNLSGYPEKWEDKDERELFELMMNSETSIPIAFGGVNMRRQKNAERRISNRQKQIKIEHSHAQSSESNQPVINTDNIIFGKRKRSEAVANNDISSDESKIGDSDFEQTSCESEDQSRRKAYFPRDIDLSNVAAEQARYGVSNRLVQNLLSAFALCINLPSYLVPSFGKIRSNFLKSSEAAVAENQELISKISNSNIPVGLHFDGADLFEVALFNTGEHLLPSKIVPLSITEFQDSANADEVMNWLYSLLSEHKVISNIKNIATDTTALNSGKAADGGGVLKKLQQKIKDESDNKNHGELICFYSMCESHSNELRCGVFLTFLSESIFGQPTCESAPSSTQQSFKILSHNLHAIHAYSSEKLWANIDNEKFSWPSYFRKLKFKDPGDIKSCHRWVYNFVTNNQFIGKKLPQTFQEQGCRWFGYLSSLLLALLIKPHLLKNLSMILKSTRSAKILGYCENASEILSKIEDSVIKEILELAKTAFTCFFKVVDNDFTCTQQIAIDITKEYANLVPRVKSIAKNELFLDKLEGTLNRQLYNASSVFWPLHKQHQLAVRDLLKSSGSKFAKKVLSYSEIMSNSIDNKFSLGQLKKLSYSDLYDEELIVNSPYFHHLLSLMSFDELIKSYRVGVLMF